MFELLTNGLINKTIILLIVFIIISYAGAYTIIALLRAGHLKGHSLIKKAKNSKAKNLDLKLDSIVIAFFTVWLLFISLLFVLIILIFPDYLLIKIVLFALFSLFQGAALAVYTINLNETAVLRAILAAIIVLGISVLITTQVSVFPINLPPLLLFSTLLLAGLGTIIAIAANKLKRSDAAAAISLVVFIGYLNYQLERLLEDNQDGLHNTWEMAFLFSSQIYIAILNVLFDVFTLNS